MTTYQEKTPSTGSFNLTQTVSADGTISGTYSFTPRGNMLEIEESVLDLVNTIGREVLTPSLASFDADGRPFTLGGIKFYSRGLFHQVYQSSFGPIHVDRYVYQSSHGGRTFVPLENKAHLVLNSTPHLAKMVSSKMAQMPSTAVETDFAENHRRPISRDYIKSLSDTIGTLAQNIEQICKYEDPFDIKTEDIKTISVSLDGTTILFTEDGKKVFYREAMVGVISLINADGERLHTIYMGEAPEYGKEKFLNRLDLELTRAKARYPNAFVQGIADGAASNWAFLESRTQTQALDFYHLSTYVNKAADTLFPKNQIDRAKWSKDWNHKIKFSNNGVELLIDEIQERKKAVKKSADDIEKVLVYLSNQKDRTHYRRERTNNRPIGSGVTEAACKTLIKQRMCGSGMRWKLNGASNIIAIRSLVLSKNRWAQFWNHYMRCGIL
jgi:hypothetical protein